MGRMSTNVTFLGSVGSNTSWTPEQMLEEALSDVRTGKRTAQKAMVLFLDTSDKENNYIVGYSMSQISCSQAIALMRVAEAMFLSEMGF